MPLFVIFVVHQGSVLSPLLFNIVHNFLTSKEVLYSSVQNFLACNVMQEFLLRVLFSDDIALSSETSGRVLLETMV